VTDWSSSSHIHSAFRVRAVSDDRCGNIFVAIKSALKGPSQDGGNSVLASVWIFILNERGSQSIVTSLVVVVLLPILEIGKHRRQPNLVPCKELKATPTLFDEFKYSRFTQTFTDIQRDIRSDHLLRSLPGYIVIFNPRRHPHYHVLLFVAVVGEDDLRE
jgi:hypothetical protein